MSVLSCVSVQDVELIRLMSRVETAQFKMRSRDLMLDEDMLQSLMELPEHYDFGLYSRFLNEYGTHYITHGVMGGLMDYVIVVNKEAMKEHSNVLFRPTCCSELTRQAYRTLFLFLFFVDVRNVSLHPVTETLTPALIRAGFRPLA